MVHNLSLDVCNVFFVCVCVRACVSHFLFSFLIHLRVLWDLKHLERGLITSGKGMRKAGWGQSRVCFGLGCFGCDWFPPKQTQKHSCYTWAARVRKGWERRHVCLRHTEATKWNVRGSLDSQASVSSETLLQLQWGDVEELAEEEPRKGDERWRYFKDKWINWTECSMSDKLKSVKKSGHGPHGRIAISDHVTTTVLEDSVA